ncbi:neuromedin-U receptor 2-like [Bolinopsis microptera]|uniref:neuromedin-U receptor 2-like n=1 Tax=Bolinopsis microptera TaxID=2820187 RepID=UPI003079F494
MHMLAVQEKPSDQYCQTLTRVLFNSGVAITVLSCVALFLNLGILIVYWKARRLLTPQYLAIINVVVSDLCSAIVGVTFRGPGMVHPSLFYGGSACPDETTASDSVSTFCFWSPYIAWAFAYQNACAIAILSLDRFIAISFPFWYKVMITKTRARRITYITWGSIISYLALHAILLHIGYTTVVWVPADGRCMYRVQSDSQDIDSEWRFKIFEDSIFFIFPLVVTVVCYLFILAKVIKSRHQKEELVAVQTKPLCLTFCIVVSSCVPWILYFISNYMQYRVHHINVMIVSYIFFYVSPIVNPIIFSTRSKTFHHVFWDRVIRSKSKRKESYIKRYKRHKSGSSTTSYQSRAAPRISNKSRDIEPKLPPKTLQNLKPINALDNGLVLENECKDVLYVGDTFV